MTKKQRRRILSKRFECLICNAVIESMSPHNFVRCFCGNLGLDGGSDYTKVSFKVGGWHRKVFRPVTK